MRAWDTFPVELSDILGPTGMGGACRNSSQVFRRAVAPPAVAAQSATCLFMHGCGHGVHWTQTVSRAAPGWQDWQCP